MDFSPYKRQQSPYTQPKKIKINIYIYFIVACVVGFMIFWTVKSYFFKEEGENIFSTFQNINGIAETQVTNIGVWSSLSNGGLITGGDKIRIKKGYSNILVIDESLLYLGEDSEIFIKSLKKLENGKMFGEILVNQSPILFSGNNEFDEEKELKIWLSDNLYVDAEKSTFLFENNLIHVIDGERVHIVKLNDEKKISSQKTLGVGQSLNTKSFALMATPPIIKNLPLVREFNEKSNKTSSNLLNSENDNISENTDLNNTDNIKPVIILPKFTGTIINVNKEQNIRGTVSKNAKKVTIEFLHEEKNDKLSVIPTTYKDDENLLEFSYTASPTYKNLLKGVNTYKIYSEDELGNKSPATVLILNYNENSQVSNNETNDYTGKFAITSPNNGKDGEIDGNIIIISGEATSNTAYVTIENQTEKTNYTLQKYKQGEKTWKYTSKQNEGTYNYKIYAKDINKNIIFTDTIKIIVKKQKPIPTSKATTPPTKTPNIKKTPIPTKKTTPKPAVTLSTLEATR
jgi:hypothetical protein